MLTLRLFAFMALCWGCLKLTGVSIKDIFSGMMNRPKSIREQIAEVNGKKKNFIAREIDEVCEILRMTGRENKIPVIFIACGISAAVGAVIASLLSNPFMIPVLGGGCLFIPIWYVRLTALHYKKDIAEELETALSIVTTAYLRNEDIVTAVEENIPYLNSPIKEVFNEFLIGVKLIDADIVKGIGNLKQKINNDIFHEWCDALIACQYDRNLKSTLTPIVTKLSDVRIVNSELELMLAEPRKEFVIMSMLLVSNIPLLYFLNKEWFNILMFSIPGKIVLAIDVAAIFISGSFVIRLTKPIEIRR